MTLEEFVIETKTLEEFYGKDYNQTQIKIWFDELKFYSVEKYRKAIINTCKSSQYRPTLSQILDSIMRVKLDTEEQERTECMACHGTGYVIYHKKENGYDYEYACLCNCQNAIGKEYDGTKIADKEHRSKYYIAKAEDVFGITKPKEEPVVAEQMTF